MTQSLIDVSKLKDFDSKAAIDTIGTILTAANIGSTGAISSAVIGAAGRKVTITGASGLISYTPTGTDSNIDQQIFTKGTGSVYLGGTTTANASAKFVTTASAVNQLVVTPSATGSALVLALGGSGADASRDTYLQGNGTGAARLKGGTGAVTAPTGYVGEVMGDMVFGTGTTATITVTIAAPGVVTWTAHGFSTVVPQPVVFTTTIALPTGINSGTVYYTIPSTVTTNTFQIATTIANALAATAITTSGSQSGTQTGTAGCSLANNTAADVCGLALTAGDWDVWAVISWNLGGTTTWTKLETSISQTTATLATSGAVRGTTYAALFQISAAATNGVSTVDLGPMVVNVSATTNIFLVAKAAFAISTAGAYGFIMARRRA